MELKRLICYSLIVLVIPINVSAQTDSTMKFSLTEAQDFAIDNYFISKNASLDIQAAKKRVWETTAMGLPQVSADGSYQHIPGEIPEFDFGLDSLFGYVFNSLDDLGYPPPDGLVDTSSSGSNAIAPKNSISYSITVSQLIFSGQYIVGLQAAKVYKMFSEKNYEKVKIEIKESVAGTYFTLLILRANKEVLIHTLDNLKMNLDHTRKSYAVGLVEETDVDQLDLTVKRTENDLTTIENQIETMHRMLNYQMGIPSGISVELTSTLDQLITQNVVTDSVYTFVLEDNIDYKILDTQENLQELLVDLEKATYLPTISGFYTYTDKTNKTNVDFTINHMIGVGVSWPIFTSGSRNARVSQARIEMEKAQNMKEQESERLILAAEQSKYDYQTALRKYYNEKQNFNLSEKVFHKAAEQFKQGMISSLDLSLFNNQYLGAQLSYSMAIQELLNSKVRLDKAHNQL